jgi:ketosteroid isomerase-like protein
MSEPDPLEVPFRLGETTSQLEDRKALVALVVQMAEASSADGLTKCWHPDVVWFDTITLIREGSTALEDFREQHKTITNLRTKIVRVEAFADGDLGFAFSIQHFQADGINGGKDIDFVFRDTDCFLRTEGEWQVIHQHVSLPFDLETYTVILDSPV